jgi:hypothetical protein
MAYATIDFPTKRALREAVARGDRVTIFQPASDVTGFAAPRNGRVALEGPHYPAPHTWYAQVELVDGCVVKVK